MNRKNWLRIFLVPTFVLSLFLITSCSKDDKDDKKGSVKPDQSTATAQPDENIPNKIRVINLSGMPLAGAQVLIGKKLNDPFPGNFLETDSDGLLTIPDAWSDEAAVTVSATGYVRATYLGQNPEGKTLILQAKDTPSNLALVGAQTGFQVTNWDGIVDFGWVLPTFNRQELFNFKIERFISLQMDSISILGQKIELPSNIALPRQKETYIFPITLEKLSYRMYFNTPGVKKIFSGRGQFPLRPVVDGLSRGKDFFEMINYFKINGGSLRNIEITDEKTTANLPVSDLSFSQSRNFQSPVFDQSQVLISLALSEDNGVLFPTDLKNVAANSKIALVTAPGSTPHLLTLLKNKAESTGSGMDRFSAVLVPFEEMTRPQFLPLLRNPELISASHFKSELIDTINGVSIIGSYATLSTVEDKILGGTSVQVLTKLWDVYDRDWSTEYDLPEWPEDVMPRGKKRWEVSRAGSLFSDTRKTVDLGPGLFESVTHATHSSIDF
jgi:hypothetical protein